MIKIYKELTKNELGLTGSHQAGILVPKEIVKKGFFPFLNPELFNPREQIIFHYNSEFFIFNYIYYNSKIHGRGTRNEYRLTGMTKFFREFNLKQGNILCFNYSNNDNKYSISIVKNDEEYDIDKPLIIKAGWYTKEVEYGFR